MSTPIESVPGLSRPARRALAEAGYTSLDQLDGVPSVDLLKLHGFGPKGITVLSGALSERGLSLGHDGHAAGQAQGTASSRKAATTRTASGNSKGPSTAPTDVDPREYVAGLSQARRVQEGHLLLDLLDDLTNERARMWGPSMIGWGEQHYTYATGWSGDMFVVGFSPRKAALSLYGVAGNGYDPDPADAELLSTLGKHRTGVSCVYVNKLPDIDLDVLRELWRRTWESGQDAGWKAERTHNGNG